MSQSGALPYLGSRISLISKAGIRYEGTLYSIDTAESTVSLAKVKSYGTEDRPCDRPVPPRDEIYEYIIFRGSDISDLHVCEPPKTSGGLVQQDPAIVKVDTKPVTPPPGFQRPPPAQPQQQPPPPAANAMPAGGPPLNAGGLASAAIGSNNISNNMFSGSGPPAMPVAAPAAPKPVMPMQPQQQQMRQQPNDIIVEQQRQEPIRGAWRGGSSRQNVYQEMSRRPDQQQQMNHRAQQQHHQQQQLMQNLGAGDSRRGGGHYQQQQQQQQPMYNQGHMNQRDGMAIRRPYGVANFNRGGRQPHPGAAAAGRQPPKFEGDYDFESANQDLAKELQKLDVKSPDVEEQIEELEQSADAADHDAKNNGYDKAKSFFDNISSEAVDRATGKSVRPINWREERKINTETFGPAPRGARGGGGRGGPRMRSGYSRGYGYARGTGYNRGYGYNQFYRGQSRGGSSW